MMIKRSVQYLLLALLLNAVYLLIHVSLIENIIAEYQFRKTEQHDDAFLKQFEQLHQEYVNSGGTLTEAIEDKIDAFYGVNVDLFAMEGFVSDLPDLAPTEYRADEDGVLYWRVESDTMAMIHMGNLPWVLMFLNELILAGVLFLINASILLLAHYRYESKHLNLVERYASDRGNSAVSLQDVIQALIDDEKNRSALIDEQIQNHKDLLHGVAHEFRSPLARMEFALEMLSQDTPEQNQLKQTLEQNINELNDLIAELLSFSRLAHRGSYECKDSVEMAALVDRVKENLKTIYPKLIFVNELDHSLRHIGE